jgi:Tfp pilus assembly protein PilX
VGETSARNSAGWVLFVLLMSLLLVNLYTTGRKAYAKRSGD